MTDVQVNNARRVGFTALALVTFWVMAWRVYWMGCDSFYARDGVMERLMDYRMDWSWFRIVYSLLVASPGLLPSVLLCPSLHHSLFTLRDRWFLLVTVCFCVSMYFCFDLGMGDVVAAAHVSALLNDTDWWSMLTQNLAVVRQNHVVSWLWLLLPIILTTVFVIFGAWRRAVRDAEVEAVGGDPDGHRSPA